MELVKYTDYAGLKYALSKFLDNIDTRYLMQDDVELLLYTNPNMTEVSNVKEGLDTITLNVVGIVKDINDINASINELGNADQDILSQAKAYTNEALNNQTRLKFAIVEKLPENKKDISTSTIYLVPNEQGNYDEYIYVIDKWETIGTTATDLSDYYTKKEVDTKVNQLQKEIQGKLDKKVDKEYGKVMIYESEVERLSKLKDYDDTEVRELIDDKAEDIFKAPKNMYIDIGGLTEGTDVNNLSIHQVLRQLLFPYLPPIVSTKLKYSPVKSLYEHGEIITVTGLDVSIQIKSNTILRADMFVNYALHDTITNGVTYGTTIAYTYSTPIQVKLPCDDKYFKVQVVDDTNKVYEYGTVPFKFTYPYYWGVVNTDTVVNEQAIKSLNKVVESKGNKSQSFTMNNQCMVFAYPFSYGKLTSILDPNGFEMINAFVCTEVDIQCLDKSIQKYYVYQSNASTNSKFKMTFKF